MLSAVWPPRKAAGARRLGRRGRRPDPPLFARSLHGDRYAGPDPQRPRAAAEAGVDAPASRGRSGRGPDRRRPGDRGRDRLFDAHIHPGRGEAGRARAVRGERGEHHARPADRSARAPLCVPTLAAGAGRGHAQPHGSAFRVPGAHLSPAREPNGAAGPGGAGAGRLLSGGRRADRREHRAGSAAHRLRAAGARGDPPAAGHWRWCRGCLATSESGRSPRRPGWRSGIPWRSGRWIRPARETRCCSQWRAMR